MAGDHLTACGGEEMRGMCGHHDIDIGAMVFQQAQDLEGLKGCNTSGNS